MTIKEMVERKKELGYSYAQIAELSGVPVGTVQKVLGGITESPRYDTLMALEKVLGDDVPSMVCDIAYHYVPKKQGQYTVEDYYKIPEERRVELIDGWIYDMAAPTSIHQIIAGYLHSQLLNYVIGKKGTCMPMISPLDVQLNCDNKTMVQPDVVVVCDRDKIIKRCVYGAPDLVVEIISPWSKRRDMTLKAVKYAETGVKEYWLIDPDKQKIIVYDYMKDDYSIYGFESKIPVSIWDGDCVVDFQKIYEYILFLYDK